MIKAVSRIKKKNSSSNTNNMKETTGDQEISEFTTVHLLLDLLKQNQNSQNKYDDR